MAHLGTTKATEGGVAGKIGATHVARGGYHAHFVRVLHVEQGAVHDGLRQVARPARVVVDVTLEGLDGAVCREADLVSVFVFCFRSCSNPGRGECMYRIHNQANQATKARGTM